MRINCSIAMSLTLVFTLILSLTIASTQLRADTGTCGGQSTTLPFTDVPSGNIFFCSIAEAFFSGLTNGTSPTTYSPSANVTREQMAAFITRTLDQGLKRSSNRAALDQWWTPAFDTTLAETGVGDSPLGVKSDGADLWVANFSSGTVSRVRASDGKLLETWTNAPTAHQVLVARGFVYVTGATSPGSLYRIDPRFPAGNVVVASSALGGQPHGIAFDGERIWTANNGTPDSVSIYSTRTGAVTTVTTGFNNPFGILYDGANIWVTNSGADTLLKLNQSGSILQTIPVGNNPFLPTFDGINIWVPNRVNNTVTVVRASTGAVLATLTGNGLSGPTQAAFDGERIMVTNEGNRVSMWKAADLTPLGSFNTPFTGDGPYGVCSDGLHFWVTLNGADRIKRF